MTTNFDVVILGAGPAGLSAAHMLGRARRRVLIIDSGKPRNRFVDAMHAVLGMDNLPPTHVAEIGRRELAPYDVTFVDASVRAVTASDERVRVVTNEQDFTSRALVVATGTRDQLPEIPGLAEHWGTRVFQCPYCHGWEFRDQRIAVIFTSPMGAHHAQMLRQWSDRVTAFTAAVEPMEDALAARLLVRGTRIVSAPVTAVSTGEEGLTIHAADGSETQVDAIFLVPQMRPQDEFLPDLERVDAGFGSVLRTDEMGRTSHPRIWASGNVTNLYANVPMSMGSGSATGAACNAALVEEDTQAALALAEQSRSA